MVVEEQSVLRLEFGAWKRRDLPVCLFRLRHTFPGCLDRGKPHQRRAALRIQSNGVSQLGFGLRKLVRDQIKLRQRHFRQRRLGSAGHRLFQYLLSARQVFLPQFQSRQFHRGMQPGGKLLQRILQPADGFVRFTQFPFS